MNRPTYDEAVAFHGHACPGLAIGYRMTVAALEALASARSSDEELVAIVENDACGVDAVQFVSGCTFGKGNVLFRDHGKPVYTFFSRATGRGVRVVGHRRGMPTTLRDDRDGRIRWILTAPLEQVVSWEDVTIDEPAAARVQSSIPCAACGEPVMEGRLQAVDGRRLCIPCADSRRPGVESR